MNTWRKVGCCLAAVAAAFAVHAEIYRVSPTATGGGSGASWESTMTFDEAKAAAQAGGEIWLKAGTYDNFSVYQPSYAPSMEVRILGGFEGTEDSADARPAGLRTVFDGKNTVTNLMLLNNSKMLVFERIDFVNALLKGVYKPSKTGAGALIFNDCSFVANGTTCTSKSTNVPDWGGGLALGAGSSLAMTNCLFAGNKTGPGPDGTAYGGKACALYCGSLATIDLYGCVFATNGLSMAASNSRSTYAPHTASAIIANNISGKIALDRCRFFGNRANTYSSTGGATVAFSGCKDAVSVANCVFAGNLTPCSTDNRTQAVAYGGAILVNMSASDKKVDINHCTFGYNVTDGTKSPAALNLCKGAVKVRNSIFWGNRVGYNTTTGYARDIQVKTDATLDIDYSHFDGSLAASVSEETAGSITYGTDGVQHFEFTDPLFVTRPETVAALMKPESGTVPYVQFDAGTEGELAKIDLHVMSPAGYRKLGSDEWFKSDGVASPAIDAGEGDWSNEPEPNGETANLGAYGNTDEASKTVAAAKPVIGDLDISFVGEWTQPEVAFEMSGGTYLATVTVYIGTGEDAEAGTAYQCTNVVNGVTSGDTVRYRASYYFDPDDVMYVRVVASVRGADDVKADNGDGTIVVGTKPPWAGKGGPANVIHYRPGATGTGDGGNWTDACTNLEEAVALVTTLRDEIWIARPVFSHAVAQPTYAPKADVIFRGGFAGTENAATERPAGAKTTFDGCGAFDGFSISGTPAKTFERLVFTHGGTHGFSVTEAGGSLTFTDCDFTDNSAPAASNAEGLGAYVSGRSGQGCAVSFTDCTFIRNQRTTGSTVTGGAVSFDSKGIASAAFENCLFVSNGWNFAEAVGGQSRKVSASAINASVRVVANNCRFLANRAGMYSTSCGGCVVLGAASRSAFTNCLWVGNEDVHCGDNCSWQRGANGGALSVYGAGGADVVNCAFVSNLGDGADVPGGINVRGTGPVSVRNCIFHSNVVGELATNITVGADIYVKAGSSATVSYSMFDADSDACFGAAEGGTLTRGEGLVFGDPRFVGSLDGVSIEQTAREKLMQSKFSADSTAVFASFNAHLKGLHYVDERTGETVTTRGRHSPAIDAGDLADDWSNEPEPNGGRINMGFYGNTPWATSWRVPGLCIFVR